MAKTFDPSQLSAADQSAFAQWQQQLQQYVAANGGGVPAPVTYALAKPDYLKDHPELQEGYNIVTGASLPPAVKEAVKGYHPVWGDAKGNGSAGFQKDSGLFNKWETWLQLGLGGAVGGLGASAALAGSAAPAAASTTAGTAGTAAGATSAYGPLAGGLATDISVPSSIAAEGGAAAGAGAAAAGTSSWWKDLLGIGSKSAAIRTAANLAGNYLQSRQVDKAVQAQVDAANKALDLQSNVYQQQRADLAPYRNVGSASIGELSRLVGLPAGTDTTTPYFQQQAAAQQATAQQNQQAQNRQPPVVPSQAMPRSATIAGLAPTDQAGMVNMLSPDGRPARVPQSQVQSALAAGGRMAS